MVLTLWVQEPCFENHWSYVPILSLLTRAGRWKLERNGNSNSATLLIISSYRTIVQCKFYKKVIV